MVIEPNETLVTDAKRIHVLTRSHLAEVARDASGWNVLYRDPLDGRYWEMTYPHGEMHGGGPPRLLCLALDDARERYGAIHSDVRL